VKYNAQKIRAAHYYQKLFKKQSFAVIGEMGGGKCLGIGY
jgi:hypothetical protein